MNILSHIGGLPKNIANKIARNAVRYELLNLVTLKNPCPFLEKKECLIYKYRPIQSRFFGLYPEIEYKKLRQDSKVQNAGLARTFCMNYQLHLPQKVLEYDIAQCSNNVDEKGNPIVLTAPERNLMYEQILRLQSEIIPEELIPEETISRFSYFYSLLHFTEEELQQLQIKAIKEFLESGESPTADETVKAVKFAVL